jgi:hypothetical protein
MTAKVEISWANTSIIQRIGISGTVLFFKDKKIERDEIGLKSINQITHRHPWSVREKNIPRNEAKV